MWGLLGLTKYEWEKRREKWKSERTNFGGKNEKSFHHIGRRKQIVVLILGNTFFTC